MVKEQRYHPKFLHSFPEVNLRIMKRKAYVTSRKPRPRVRIIQPHERYARYCYICDERIHESYIKFEFVDIAMSDRICLDCFVASRDWRAYRVPASPQTLVGFDLLDKEKQNKLSKSLWPNQVELSLRPKLNLVKCIDEMSKEELRIELEKRGITQFVALRVWEQNEPPYIVTKGRVMRRLERYLNDDKCKRMNELLVIGYCKKIERDYRLNVPTYLHKIVSKYYPAILYKDKSKRQTIAFLL